MINNKKKDLERTKVSFLMIVPTLNSYKELDKLVTSLKSQTYKQWRTVFIDGDSSSDHKEWINSCCTCKETASIYTCSCFYFWIG